MYTSVPGRRITAVCPRSGAIGARSVIYGARPSGQRFPTGLKVTVPWTMLQSLGLSFLVLLVSNPQISSGSSQLTGVPERRRSLSAAVRKRHVYILNSFTFQMPVIALLFHPSAEGCLQLIYLCAVLRVVAQVIQLPRIFLQIE
jgi:hypothetical protein